MTPRVDFMQLGKRPPMALFGLYPDGRDYKGPFCTLELRTAEGSVTFFLDGEYAAWAQAVAAAVNTPVASEVAA